MALLEETYPQHVQMPRIKFYHALAISMQERVPESIRAAFKEVIKNEKVVFF